MFPAALPRIFYKCSLGVYVRGVGSNKIRKMLVDLFVLICPPRPPIVAKRFDEELWERSRYGEREFDTDTVTAKELTHYTYALNLELNFVNNFNLRIKRYERAVNMFNDLLRRYPTHVFGLISLYLAYEGLNDKNKCLSIEKKIFESISVDPSSKKMLRNHGELLENTKFYDLGSKFKAA